MIVDMSRTFSPPSRPAPADRRAAVTAVLDELNGAIRLLRCAATGRMVRQGISMTQVHVLWQLEEQGTLPMSRLAELLEVSFSNVTGLVDRLEERHLVERLRAEDDRRVVLVRLTAIGQDLLDELQVMKRDLTEAVLGHLDDRQLSRLQAALRDFRSAIRAVADADPARFGLHDGPDADHPHSHDPSHAHVPAVAGGALLGREHA